MSETTLLVFLRGGSNTLLYYMFKQLSVMTMSSPVWTVHVYLASIGVTAPSQTATKEKMSCAAVRI